MTNMTQRMFYRRILTTPDFFFVFAKHLDMIFDDGWIYDIEDKEDVVCGVDSTIGWRKALERTCRELNILDAFEYWNNLPWDKSDCLDAYIGELLCAVVYDENSNRIVKD